MSRGQSGIVLCVCVCVYVCVCFLRSMCKVCTYKHVIYSIYIYTYIHTYICVCVCVYPGACVRMYAYIYVCVCVCVCVCIICACVPPRCTSVSARVYSMHISGCGESRGVAGGEDFFDLQEEEDFLLTNYK